MLVRAFCKTSFSWRVLQEDDSATMASPSSLSVQGSQENALTLWDPSHWLHLFRRAAFAKTSQLWRSRGTLYVGALQGGTLRKRRCKMYHALPRIQNAMARQHWLWLSVSYMQCSAPSLRAPLRQTVETGVVDDQRPPSPRVHVYPSRSAWAFAPMSIDPRWLGGMEVAAMCGLPLLGNRAIWSVVINSQEAIVSPTVSFKRTARLRDCGQAAQIVGTDRKRLAALALLL